MDEETRQGIMDQLSSAETYDQLQMKLIEGAYEFAKGSGKIDMQGPVAQLLENLKTEFADGSGASLENIQGYIVERWPEATDLFDEIRAESPAEFLSTFMAYAKD